MNSTKKKAIALISVMAYFVLVALFFAQPGHSQNKGQNSNQKNSQNSNGRQPSNEVCASFDMSAEENKGCDLERLKGLVQKSSFPIALKLCTQKIPYLVTGKEHREELLQLLDDANIEQFVLGPPPVKKDGISIPGFDIQCAVIETKDNTSGVFNNPTVSKVGIVLSDTESADFHKLYKAAVRHPLGKDDVDEIKKVLKENQHGNIEVISKKIEVQVQDQLKKTSYFITLGIPNLDRLDKGILSAILRLAQSQTSGVITYQKKS